MNDLLKRLLWRNAKGRSIFFYASRAIPRDVTVKRSFDLLTLKLFARTRTLKLDMKKTYNCQRLQLLTSFKWHIVLSYLAYTGHRQYKCWSQMTSDLSS